MPIHYAQGDIFTVGVDEGFDFVLVFGRIGLNEMAEKWQAFRRRFQNQFGLTDDPFVHFSQPVMFSPGKWVKFVAAQENNGMHDEPLSLAVNEALGWAASGKLRSVITNGIVNTDHGRVTADNRASDDRRVRDLNELVRAHVHRFHSIKLISLNDAFTRNF